MVPRVCRVCGWDAEEIRCPRCNALKLTSCAGACSGCASACAKGPAGKGARRTP